MLPLAVPCAYAAPRMNTDTAKPRSSWESKRVAVPVAAFESTRQQPTVRATFGQAKVIHVLDGHVRVHTHDGTFNLAAGAALALGASVWCELEPTRPSRLWTVYIDEAYLRSYISWVLPEPPRAVSRVHPNVWDGSPLMLNPGVAQLRRFEPVWRQISIAQSDLRPVEAAIARSLVLFGQWIEMSVTGLLRSTNLDHLNTRSMSPVRGRMTAAGTVGVVADGARILRERLHEDWTVERLAAELAVSRSHLTRLFVTVNGAAPMRFLVDVRLTEFTRLLEETDIPIATAARQVGWSDSRVAAKWFRRRYGTSPSTFRKHPQSDRAA